MKCLMFPESVVSSHFLKDVLWVWMWTLFKVFIEFVTVLCFYFSSWFGFLVLRHVASWLPNQGPNSHLRTLESEVLATRPPGSSQFPYFLSLILLLHAFSDFTDRYYRVFHMLLVFRLQCSKLGIHFPLD